MKLYTINPNIPLGDNGELPLNVVQDPHITFSALGILAFIANQRHKRLAWSYEQVIKASSPKDSPIDIHRDWNWLIKSAYLVGVA